MLTSIAQMFLILLGVNANRKYVYLFVVFGLVLLFCFIDETVSKCISDASCMNGGVCMNGTCVCPDGWQGDDCQFCGGKVRLTNSHGYIHDGAGNYSVGVKCSWLIDAREHTTISNALRNNVKTPTIRLHLEEFATECGWDHLYVFDGDSVESPLLAVFSGLMYNQNFSIRRVPEVVAHSGSVLLHFFSDDAYNMSGFNISYKINGCPTTDSRVNCSGHGFCDYIEGTCICESDYTGIACHLEKCPRNCGAEFGRGFCHQNKQRCQCKSGFAGTDCMQDETTGFWTTILPSGQVPIGSASHGAAVWGDTLHIISGESYGRGELLYTYDFNGNIWETVHTAGSNSPPESRYGASTVIYGDKIYIYGGVIGKQGVSNELWAFDVSAKTWENITVKYEQCNMSSAMCGPLKSSGHTATLVPGYDPSTNTEYQYMVVIFGHSPQFDYLNTVQEYAFSTRTWRVIETRGYPVKGGFGHSADYDPLTQKIYVYGGIISESESNQIISNNLLSYDPNTRIWSLLTAASSGRFLHTANFISDGLMMVFGGNTHNDTSHSFGAKCYSKELMMYDVLCDSWHNQEIPDDLRSDISRFGHSAVKFLDSLYIYGGFDGQMLSDLLKYTPGSCDIHQKAEYCLNARPGLKCVWDIKESKCVRIGQVSLDVIRARDQDVYLFCPKESRLIMTQQLLLDGTRCSEMHDCHSCVSTSFGCTYCNTGTCSKEKCRELNLDGISIPGIPISSIDKCRQEDAIGLQCSQLHDCRACHSNSPCHWDFELNKCKIGRIAENNQTYEEQSPCPTPCAELNSCMNCTSEECIWCQNEERCVDKNAYTVSFPYGQCREWTTITSKCRTTLSGGKSQCEYFKTCSQCRDDPACGWCDDGSNTGLGTCMPGGDSGSQDESMCPSHSWYFTQCPSCQCNGHSTCPDSKTCIMPCNNLTTGANCERCRDGYWGNPVNGGKCHKCECNEKAELCHPETAKCFCSTKGLAGDHCEKCDATNHYHGDPSVGGSCYYDLTIDYQFTFNLSKKEDRHFTQINFRNTPVKSDIDADYSILCSVAAKMNITIRTGNDAERILFSNLNCSQFRYRFSKNDHHFGLENNTTFYVYVYDFKPPLWIQIAFSQYPKLNLQQFFITFSTCFLLLLLLAAVLWKIKQKYDMFRRRQRLFVEMEQMASRPFSEVLVDIENRRIDPESPTPVIESLTKAQKKRKKDSPSPIALEPCSGNRAAVLSLLVRLPTGALNYPAYGQTSGLAIASALVTLGNPRKLSIEHPKESKTKRKQSQHPDNCI